MTDRDIHVIVTAILAGGTPLELSRTVDGDVVRYVSDWQRLAREAEELMIGVDRYRAKQAAAWKEERKS